MQQHNSYTSSHIVAGVGIIISGAVRARMLGNAWVLAVCMGIVSRSLVMQMTTYISESVRTYLEEFTLQRLLGSMAFWLCWVFLNGVLTPLVVFIALLWGGMLLRNIQHLAKGEIYFLGKELSRDDILLIIVLICTLFLTRVYRALPHHTLYVVLASVALCLFVLLHTFGHQTSKKLFSYMSFRRLLAIRFVSAGRFLTKERMITMESRIVEKIIVEEKVVYITDKAETIQEKKDDTR